ncbi:hypothetical protein AAFC00_004538 [Neodothiora populina]
MITLGLLIAGSFQCDVWELGLFWSGMFLAEASLIQESFSDVEAKIEEGAPMHKEPPKHSESENKAFWYFAFVVGLVLLSIPPQKTEFAPFYSNLIKWSPQGLREGEKHRFWMAIGSVLVIWSINNALSLQGIFSCALGRYLGNISYALYLVHGFINHTLGYSVVYNLWENTTGKSTTRQYETGFALGGLIVIPAAIWAADLFWRYIDTPIVKFTRWLENQLLEPV